MAKRKLTFTHWQIAYRTLDMEKFQLIPNPEWGWAADPFVIEYQGYIYIFAELFLYKTERNGVIGYCIFENGKFSEWKVSMDEHWHLSYPNVFQYNDRLYLCPESYQSKEICIYELEKFPDQWRKVKTLLRNGKYVDSTFLHYINNYYMVTFEIVSGNAAGRLLIYSMDSDGNLSEPRFITDDEGKARPGGNFIYLKDKTVRVSQNNSNGYGGGLVFSEVDSVWPKYKEHELRRLTVGDIDGEWRRKFTGIHTYNCCKKMEVIDLKYTVYSLKEHIASKRVRKVFVNKYR